MLSDRQREILGVAAEEGRVAVEELSNRFGVTPQTIRRDLNELCERGLLARQHGGARPLNTVANMGYERRRHSLSDEKRRIGEAAAARVPNGSSLILNIGTTTEHVARALQDHRDLMVITNNIHVVNILSGSPAKELVLAGGVVRQSDGGVVGEAAMEFMRQFRVDLAVIGASALDEDGTVLDFDYREVSVARAIIETARRTMLVADHSKFQRRATVRICDIAAIDMLVTDKPPPQDFTELCRREGVEIVVAADGTPAGAKGADTARTDAQPIAGEPIDALESGALESGAPQAHAKRSPEPQRPETQAPQRRVQRTEAGYG